MKPTKKVEVPVAIVPVPSPPVLRDDHGRFRPGSGAPQRRGPGAQPANLNASRHPWRAFWRRRALRLEDRWILPVLADYAGSLVADRGGPDVMTAAEGHLIELAQLARGCTMLVLAQAARGGGIAGARRGTTLTGPGQARRITDPDLAAALAKFMTIELTALRALGLERKAKPALSLAEYIEAKAQRTETPA